MSWRAYGLALLPLAAAGWLPWWATALLCVLFGLAVRWPRWEEGRLLLSLLVVGGAAVALAPAALAQGRAALVGLALHYLALFFVVIALNWSANRITDGLRRSRGALFVPLLIGLLAPQPGLLLALAGGLLAVPGRDERMGRRPEQPTPRVWWVAGAALAALLLFSVLLPRQAVNWGALGGPTPPPATAPLPPPNQTVPPDLGQTPSVPNSPGLALPFQFTIDNVFLPIDAILLGGLLLLVAGGGLLFRLRREEGRKPRLIEMLMVAGLLLTGAVWLAAGVLLSGGDGGGSGAAQTMGPGAGNALGELLSNITGRRQIDVSGFLQALLWLSLALLFALAAALFWLNFTQPREKESDEKALDGLEDAAPVSTQPALHRVRLAYRQAEELLRQHGRGRLAAETPAGYAARLTALDAVLAGPLDTLTRAYGPVRYGGRVTDEDAAQAEAAAHELAVVLPDLPPPHDPSEDSDPSEGAPDSLSTKENP
ncbi:DUF4129 domain-containing protein [Deinococcus marmoris]|uniref:DUF4129 domain-containing protein n=1 Tax=Deinococcus marmoris TaxID=249408 RepID=UPI000494E3C2|nr:DUF4129 domain-containing protein [Deinococcus marmoris]